METKENIFNIYLGIMKDFSKQMKLKIKEQFKVDVMGDRVDK